MHAYFIGYACRLQCSMLVVFESFYKKGSVNIFKRREKTRVEFPFGREKVSFLVERKQINLLSWG